MEFRSSQLLVLDPFRTIGANGQGVINQIRTGKWSVYTKRREGRRGNETSSVTLLCAEAVPHMQNYNGNLSHLEAVYGNTYKQEAFDVTVDEQLIAFLDIGAYFESRVEPDFLSEVIRSGFESVVYRGVRNKALGGSYEAGRIVNTMRGPSTAKVATLRDADGCVVSIFLVFGDKDRT